ncbi:hypothetical protein CDCA_CDCA07G2124 [Cyanidium caldarium]|uniref:PsbB mRNA maturation factor Mbb1 n=1 Tax=Cyanidium caldarium TaxID=2771 RepID=A0AAV9IUY1_CYACA|nr:hypothetical protein CDCA_CDCA07G2124 [Cyanidium caldarium]
MAGSDVAFTAVMGASEDRMGRAALETGQKLCFAAPFLCTRGHCGVLRRSLRASDVGVAPRRGWLGVAVARRVTPRPAAALWPAASARVAPVAPRLLLDSVTSRERSGEVSRAAREHGGAAPELTMSAARGDSQDDLLQEEAEALMSGDAVPAGEPKRGRARSAASPAASAEAPRRRRGRPRGSRNAKKDTAEKASTVDSNTQQQENGVKASDRVSPDKSSPAPIDEAISSTPSPTSDPEAMPSAVPATFAANAAGTVASADERTPHPTAAGDPAATSPNERQPLSASATAPAAAATSANEQRANAQAGDEEEEMSVLIGPPRRSRPAEVGSSNEPAGGPITGDANATWASATVASAASGSSSHHTESTWPDAPKRHRSIDLFDNAPGVKLPDSATDQTSLAELLESMEPAESIWRKGKLAESRGLNKLAQRLYRRAVQIDRLLGRAWLDLAKVTGRIGGGLAQTRLVLLEALSVNQENPFLWQAVGSIEQRMGNLEDARESYKRGIEYDPRHVPIFTSWGRMEANVGNYERARELFERGERFDPQSSRLLLAWADMERRAGNHAAAEQLIERAQRTSAQSPFVLVSLAAVALRDGKVDKARNLYQEALRADPGNVTALDHWGRLEASQRGREAEARALFERAIRAAEASGSKDPRPLHNLAELERCAGRSQAAESLLQRALAIQPKDGLLWYAYGTLLMEAGGRVEQARRCFEQAAALSPRDWRVLDRWSELENQAGRTSESNVLLHRSYALRYGARGEFCILSCAITRDTDPRQQSSTHPWAWSDAEMKTERLAKGGGGG